MLLLLDFEATGLDTKEARTIEIGAMITDNTFNYTGAPALSTLVKGSNYPPLIDEVIKVTNITQELLDTEGVPPDKAFFSLHEMVHAPSDIHFVVTYNTAYDHNLFKSEMKRLGLENLPGINHLLTIPWLCGLNDIKKNYEFKSRKLMHVALEYGVTVNPKLLHRALGDVELMRETLIASGTTVEEMYIFQQEPWIYVRAICEKPWIDNNVSTNLAKARGYSWERARGDTTDRVFTKYWVKRIKQSSYDDELTLPFKVERITL